MAGPATTQSDVLVIFGITGDLAKKMTFRSLYRLERRRLLDCPIVGVARRDWSDEDCRLMRARPSKTAARPSRDAVFPRFAERLSMVSGNYDDAKTYERIGRSDRRPAHPGLLPGDPALAVRPGGRRSRRRRPDQAGPRGDRKTLRPRPGLGPRLE